MKNHRLLIPGLIAMFVVMMGVMLVVGGLAMWSAPRGAVHRPPSRPARTARIRWRSWRSRFTAPAHQGRGRPANPIGRRAALSGGLPCDEAPQALLDSFISTRPETMSPAAASRMGLAGSPSTTSPTRKAPTAPTPVQTP